MDSERRKQGEVEERLARIEEKLDNALSWLNTRNNECNILEDRINTLRIEQGKQGIVIYFFTGIIASVLSIIISSVFAYLKL